MLANQIFLFAALFYFGDWIAVSAAVGVMLLYHGLMWFVARTYQWKSAVMLDRTVNVEWMNGVPDESISARAAYSAKAGKMWGCVLCKLLNLISKGHCDRVIAGTERKHYEPVG